MQGRQNGKNYKAKRIVPVSAEQDPESQQRQELPASKDAELASLNEAVKTLKCQTALTSRSLQKIIEIATSAVSVITE